jgi:thiamine biosynthesis lipoprotein
MPESDLSTACCCWKIDTRLIRDIAHRLNSVPSSKPLPVDLQQVMMSHQEPSMSHVLLSIALAAALGEVSTDNAPLQRYAFSEMLMGMPFRAVVYAPDEQSANRAVTAAFRRILELNAVCSDYDADSELNRLCATAGTRNQVPISPDLFRVLSASQQLARATEGAFDPTVGPLTRLWRRSRKSRKLPDPAVLSQARQTVGWQSLVLDADHQTATLKLPKMQLDLGGIAVGFAIDEALVVLKEQGIENALIDGSGDVGVSGPPPGEPGWRIAVAPLDVDGPASRHLLLHHAAVTTSGDAFQFVEIDGVRYSHIVDPGTGLGLTTRSSVTVIAPTCLMADSHATAVCVLGPERGLPWIRKHAPQAEALFVTATSKEQKATSVAETPGFARYEEVPRPASH